MTTDIYELRGPAGDEVWFLNKCGEYIVAGPDPVKTLADIAFESGGLDMRAQSRKTEREIAEFVMREFHGMKLILKSRKWLRIDDGRFDWKKDREHAFGKPPFETAEEMVIVCAARGWPEPEWLDDVARKIVRRNSRAISEFQK